MEKRNDLTGQRFGRWIVLGRAGSDNAGKNSTWLCRCDCGKEKVISRVVLMNGNSKSCGCLAREKSRESIKKLINKKDPRPRDERLYSIWRKMRNRCYNPRNDCYHNYGGRGITICKSWDDFYSFQTWAFACGYAEGLTLDRADVDGNYSPENCRWVTMKQQSRNKRETIYLTLNGRKQPLADWADEMGVSWGALHSRYVRGWDDEKILLTPIKKNT